MPNESQRYADEHAQFMTQVVDPYLGQVARGRSIVPPDPHNARFSQGADDARLAARGAAPAGYGATPPPPPAAPVRALPPWAQADRGVDPHPTGISNSYKPPPAAELFGQLMRVLEDPRNSWMGGPKILHGLQEGAAGIGALGGMMAGRRGLLNNTELNKFDHAFNQYARDVIHDRPRDLATFRETGMYPAADRSPRLAFSDANATFTAPPAGQANLLGDVMHHPELFERYPFLKDTVVQTRPRVSGDRSQGSTEVWMPKADHGRGQWGQFSTSPALSPDDQRSTALHEIQHLIQQHEGHALGSSPSRYLPPNFTERQARNTAALDNFYDAFQQRGYDPDTLFNVRRALLHELGMKPPTDDAGLLNLRAGQAALPTFKQHPDSARYLEQLREKLGLQKLDDAAWTTYHSVAGEQEARLTQLLADRTAAQLARTYPLDHMGWDPLRQVLRYDALEPAGRAPQTVKQFFKGDPRFLYNLEQQAATGTPPKWNDRLGPRPSRADMEGATVVGQSAHTSRAHTQKD